ncbi:MAG: hypothetical protein DRO11_08080 [Methanobacteriota archaeon]|nr:MAG: hypothetical protein DRO11_08080 [Euryarchaeota archaeon]
MVCTKCKVDKAITEFYRSNKKTNGLMSECKKCNGITHKLKEQTKEGLVTRMYNGQKDTSKSRGHRPPEYSKQELQEWLFSQVAFHELYDEWKQSKFKKALRPSVDRKEDSIHYCMSNIQLMTWHDNLEKAHRSKDKAVIQIDIESGEVIGRYSNSIVAEQATGVNRGGISNCTTGKARTAGGFIWKKDTK